MAKLGKRFKSAKHGEMQEDFVLPISENPYLCKIGEVTVRDTKARKEAIEKGKKPPAGKIYGFPFKVISGEYKGRTIFSNLNLENPSDQAVEIAFKELNSIAKAVGVESFDDTDELTGKEILVHVKVIPATANFPEKNEVRKYEAVKGTKKPSKKPGKKKGKKAKVKFD